MELAAKAGEVRYVHLGLECNGTKNALVESSEQPFNNISAENASSGIHGTAHQRHRRSRSRSLRRRRSSRSKSRRKSHWRSPSRRKSRSKSRSERSRSKSKSNSLRLQNKS
ncbi:serine/arginine-rich splicing factor 4-like isoform X2 [Palaemon carinicauda]